MNINIFHNPIHLPAQLNKLKKYTFPNAFSPLYCQILLVIIIQIYSTLFVEVISMHFQQCVAKVTLLQARHYQM